MGTVFTVTATKGNGKKYEIDLGVDILADKDASAIYAMATDAAVVQLQNRKGSMLRMANGEADILDTLKTFGYPDATVAEYVATTKTKPVTVDAIKAAVAGGKLTKEQLLAMVAEIEDSEETTE